MSDPTAIASISAPCIQQLHSEKCSNCGMDLVLEGTRFALLRPMASNPLHLAIMAGVMVAIMAAPMMTMR